MNMPLHVSIWQKSFLCLYSRVEKIDKKLPTLSAPIPMLNKGVIESEIYAFNNEM